MMLRSLQTRDPKIAWERVHSELRKLEPHTHITDQIIDPLLELHCQGMRVKKETLHWAEDNGLITVNHASTPTSYSLTAAGWDWKPI